MSMEIPPTRLTVVAPPRPALRPFSRALGFVARRFKMLGCMVAGRVRREPNSLLISKTASLGDRRFVAVVQFERRRFLIGSSPSSVTLLAQLPDAAAPAEDTAANPGASQ